MRLKDKVIIVTGGTSGIGAAIAAAAIFLFITSLPLCVVAIFIAFDLSQNLKWLLPDTRR